MIIFYSNFRIGCLLVNEKPKAMSVFRDKVAQLQSSLDSSTKSVAAKESCYPTLMIAGIAAPFLVLVLLFFLQPSFVQRKEGKKYVRDGKKTFFWSVALTLILWLGFYLYSYCTGYNAAGMVCAK